MFDLLHFENVGRFRILQVLFYFFLIVKFEGFQSFPQLFFHFVGERWQVFVVENGSVIKLDHDALCKLRSTSASIVRSSI